MAGGIQAARAGAGGPAAGSPALLGSLVQRVPALGDEDQGGRMDRRPGARRSAGARVVRARDAGRALLGCVPCAPETLPPWGAPVWGPAPWSPRSARGFAPARGRTLAPHAGHRAPSSAHGAPTVEPVVSCMAGWPWAAGGTGQPCHCRPVSSPHRRRGKTRQELIWPCGPRWGRERCAQRQIALAGAERGTGIGVVTGCGAMVLIIE